MIDPFKVKQFVEDIPAIFPGFKTRSDWVTPVSFSFRYLGLGGGGGFVLNPVDLNLVEDYYDGVDAAIFIGELFLAWDRSDGNAAEDGSDLWVNWYVAHNDDEKFVKELIFDGSFFLTRHMEIHRDVFFNRFELYNSFTENVWMDLQFIGYKIKLYD